MAGAVLLRKQYAPSDESGGRTAPHKPGHPPFIVLLLEVSAEGAPLVAFLGGLDGVSELADLQRERPRVQWARADIPDLVRATFGYGHGEGCVPGRTARPNGRNTRRQTPTCDEQVKTDYCRTDQARSITCSAQHGAAVSASAVPVLRPRMPVPPHRTADPARTRSAPVASWVVASWLASRARLQRRLPPRWHDHPVHAPSAQ
jgi:hypothetical protein